MAKRVFISSPDRPISDDPTEQAQERQRNIFTARAACRFAIHQGCIPVAPHIYVPRFLRDERPAERQAGIKIGLKAMEDCDELWVIGPRISDGMADEIAHAKEIGIPIRCIPDLTSSEEGLSALLMVMAMELTDRKGQL